MIRILYVLPHHNFFKQHRGVGGHISHALGTLSGFATLGIHADVVCSEGGSAHINGHSVFTVPNRAPQMLAAPVWAIRLLYKIGQLNKTDEFEFVYARYSLSFSPFFRIFKWLVGPAPLVIEVNSIGGQRHRWFRLLDRYALGSADRIIAVSEAVADLVRDLGSDAISSRIHVTPNGVDISRFSKVQAQRVLSGSVRIGYLGILKQDYGLEDLILAGGELIKKGYDIDIRIGGDGPDRYRLGQFATNYPVTFDGAIEFDSVPQWLADCDILIYTTSHKHAFQSPIKLLEYMAVGRPIVAARTEHVAKVLDNGALGRLYEIGNPSSLADCIAQVLGDWGAAGQVASAARNSVIAHHSWSARCTEILQLVADRPDTV